MRYITPSILFALVTVLLILAFYGQYAAVSRHPGLQRRSSELLSRLGLSCAPLFLPAHREAPRGLTFAGRRHPMEKKDRLPILLITLVYAATAFFQLGDLHAPTVFHDFGDGESVTIAISGSPLRVKGIRYYTGLGVGVERLDISRAYNVEVSMDGERWSTLWQRKDDPEDPNKVTGYYWADAEGYDPSYALPQKYNQLFKWLDITTDHAVGVQYLRITGNPAANDAGQKVLELGKFCLLDDDGNPIPFNWGMADGSQAPEDLNYLFYAGDVPEKSTWHNSTYFDEIYHARTAKEHIDGVYRYEWTHPPLGKLIIGLGIRLFGMTPFGWRFMGTLFGVLMLPILYIFLKNMFGKTPVAACGTILFAADFMHLTQTRIATIDTYGVFFILCMYFFMYRYLTLPAGTPFRKGALPLFLSGLMWGLGAASKWTVFYAGIGLAVVYFMGLYQKLRDWPADGAARSLRPGWTAATLLFSVLCFVVIPLIIYTASYLPYAQVLGVDLSLDNTLSGVGRSVPPLFRNIVERFTAASKEAGYQAAVIPQDSLTGVMAKNQWDMLTYHQGVSQAHPYSARWFQWIVDARPILYYMDNDVPGYTTRFAAFANPAVCWAGLLAILTCFASAFRRLGSKLAFLFGVGAVAALFTYKSELGENGVFFEELPQEELTRNWIIFAACLLAYLLLAALIALLSTGRHSGKDAFITVAFLSQLAPWWLISRTTFAYHYFPSILFLVFALASLFNTLIESGGDWKKPVYGLTGLSAGLYALFYPVLIGLTIPTWYEPLVKWIESWPF